MLPKAHLTLYNRMSDSRGMRSEEVRFHSNLKKGNAKEGSNYHIIVLISHASKVCSKSFRLGFSIVNEANVDVFLDFFCFFYDPTDVGNLISGFSAFSKSTLYIWKFLVHVLLKPSLKDFEHYLSSMKNECSCVVV